MTNLQLYLAIGVPIVANFFIISLAFTFLNFRLTDLREDMNKRFELMEKLFTEKLRRVEEVIDARLKSLEESVKHLEERHP